MVSFETFFATLHEGRQPFPWQSRLAARVAEGAWPAAITVPTGCGKTSIIDVWLWARKNRLVATPRRLAYVIDRRIVVDAVAQYAQALIARLPSGHDPPLVVSVRGGIVPDDTWVRDPAREAIITTTVDQVGSRLLFRAYSVGRYSAPIHAGLLGVDCLIVLDEAHLAEPFLDLLRLVATERKRAQSPLDLPWGTVVMTATPPERVHARLGIDQSDRSHPVLKKRLASSKVARLVKSAGEHFLMDLVTEARRHREEGAGVVGVVVNQVGTARAVFEQLRASGEALLLTGRVRPADRDELVEELLPRALTGTRAADREPLYVVATQTIEVGVDLDFDALVTEAAPLASLRQRFGRLDRLGELNTSNASVVHRGRGADPVYGADTDATWTWLNSVAKKKSSFAIVDFGIEPFERAINKAGPPKARTPEAPTLLPADIAMLAQTSAGLDIDLAPYLHGYSRQVDVSLCWRADLEEGGESQWRETIEAAPPLVPELLPVPFYAVRQWLRGAASPVADIEGAQLPEDDNKPAHGRTVAAVRDEEVSVVDSEQILPGDVIAVPATYGGCDRFGWAPESRLAVEDRGDVVMAERVRIRLHPRLRSGIADRLADELSGDALSIRRLVALSGIRFPGSVRATPYPGGVVLQSRIDIEDTHSPRAVGLAEHLHGVGAKARSYAERCGLPADLVRAVKQAALLHDVGKNDPRYQILLGGTRQNMLAKSGWTDAELAAEARLLSGLPRGWRHELASVASRSDEDELIRYLIATHHGRCRGVMPAAPDGKMWSAVGGAEWPAVFERVSRRFGWWGIAYLEAIVRLADWSRSEEEQIETDTSQPAAQEA